MNGGSCKYLDCLFIVFILDNASYEGYGGGQAAAGSYMDSISNVAKNVGSLASGVGSYISSGATYLGIT